MRRLTLVLSDLYLPATTADTVAIAASPLPHLEWLLRFATTHLPRDWRSHLALGLGRVDLAARPRAHLLRSNEPAIENCFNRWIATPVHLQPRQDQVWLADGGVLRLSTDERRNLCERFAQAFGPDLALQDCGDGDLLLIGLESASVRTVDPRRALGSDISEFIPTGEGARALRRLGSEIELWLNREPINAARESSRRATVSSLWLWGGQPDADAGGSPPPALAADLESIGKLIAKSQGVQFFGRDIFLTGLAAAVDMPVRADPDRFTALDDDTVKHAVVVLAPLESASNDDALRWLEAHWFAPVRASLTSGQLEHFELLVNDRVFELKPSFRWRKWRRHRNWVQAMTRGSTA